MARRLRDLPAFLGSHLVDLLCAALPPRFLLLLADVAGTLAFHLHRPRRRVSIENLRLVYGDRLGPRERRRIAEQGLRRLARVSVEGLLMGRLLGSRRAFARRVRLAGDWDALAEDQAAGRSGLIVTVHLGNWEVGARALVHVGLPCRMVVRRLENPFLEHLALRMRGDRAIEKREGVMPIRRALKRGEWVALLLDQNAGRHGLFVPWLGIQASTFHTPGVFVRRLGVPVYVGVSLCEPGLRYGFTVHLKRLDPASLAGLDEAGVLERIHRELEPFVHAAPEQYTWCHRRWKTRPPGARPGPDEPGYGRFLDRRTDARVSRWARRRRRRRQRETATTT